MEDVTASDERTVVVRWRQLYPEAGALTNNFQALPRHILAAPFERLGPAVSVVTRPTEVQQTGVESEEPDADEPAEQCAAVRIQIV